MQGRPGYAGEDAAKMSELRLCQGERRGSGSRAAHIYSGRKSRRYPDINGNANDSTD